MKLDLSDLVPQEVKFKLSGTKDVEHTLGAYTLRVQLYAAKTFGSEAIERAIATRDLIILPQLAWYVLKDKKFFADSFDNFLDAVVSYQDRETVVNAMLETAGLSQPVLEKLAKQLEKNESAPANEPTGANSTTESPASIPTP